MGCGRSKRTSTGEPEEAKSDHGQAGQGKGPREETAGGGEDRGTGTEGSPNGAPDTDTEAPGEDRTTPPATTTETCPEVSFGPRVLHNADPVRGFGLQGSGHLPFCPTI